MASRWAYHAARRAASVLSISGRESVSSYEITNQLRHMAVGSRASSPGGMSDALKWKWLKSQGADLNPCQSALHPSVTTGKQPPPTGDEVSVQKAYNPGSTCFGCGMGNKEGLQLQSLRISGGLQATVTIPEIYSSFPGIVNGGIVSTIFDCHGNWTAAIALMDQASVVKPPLTLTYEILVSYKAPTPPDEELCVRSQVVSITESPRTGSTRPTVQVDMSLHSVAPGSRAEKLLATATGIFKKTGALMTM